MKFHGPRVEFAGHHSIDSILLILFLLFTNIFLDIIFTRRVFFLWTVERSPDRLSLEEAHGMAQATLVTSKAMVNPLGQSHQITLFHVNPDPLIILVPNIEVARTTQDIPDFFGIMDML